MKIALIVADKFKNYKLLEEKLDELKVKEVISGTSNGYEMLKEYIKTRPNINISLAEKGNHKLIRAYNSVKEAQDIVVFANGNGFRTEHIITNAINEKKNLKIYSFESNVFNIEQKDNYAKISMSGNLQKVTNIDSINLDKQEVEILITKLTEIKNKMN